jgi:putative hemolysin
MTARREYGRAVRLAARAHGIELSRSEVNRLWRGKVTVLEFWDRLAYIDEHGPALAALEVRSWSSALEETSDEPRVL